MKVLNAGGIPHTRNVRGSNYNLISVFPDRLPGRAIIISVVSKPALSILEHSALPKAAETFAIHGFEHGRCHSQKAEASGL